MSTCYPRYATVNVKCCNDLKIWYSTNSNDSDIPAVTLNYFTASKCAIVQDYIRIYHDGAVLKDIKLLLLATRPQYAKQVISISFSFAAVPCAHGGVRDDCEHIYCAGMCERLRGRQIIPKSLHRQRGWGTYLQRFLSAALCAREEFHITINLSTSPVCQNL